MTTQEFSNAFDTLLASYNHKAEFGDLASYADVALDEYEKSVFLTLALDNIVKSYFDNRSNSTGQGFDDSIRRLSDFSSLITTAIPSAVTTEGSTWSTGITVFHNTTNTLVGFGNTYSGYKVIITFYSQNSSGSSSSLPGSGTTSPLNISLPIQTSPSITTINGIGVIKISIPSNKTPKSFFDELETKTFGDITFQNTNPNSNNYLGVMTIDTPISEGLLTLVSYPTGSTDAYDERGHLYNLPSNILLMLNERVKSTNNKYFVVVPISYKEYDRQMSRAYALPLKKLCWRLFEGESSTNTISEVIPMEGISISQYKIRYIRRPKPIILVDLGFSASLEPLQIDGYTQTTECELNPILHMDILEEAVRLALNSKGIETRDLKAAREQANRNN